MDSLHSPAESGPYDTFISNKMPAWVKHTVADDIKRLKPGLFPGYTAPADADNRFARAPSWQVQALLASQLRSVRRSRAATSARADAARLVAWRSADWFSIPAAARWPEIPALAPRTRTASFATSSA